MSRHTLQNRSESELLWYQRRSFLSGAAGWLAAGGFGAGLGPGTGPGVGDFAGALAAAGAASGAALPPPNASRRRRATGASTVDDADFEIIRAAMTARPAETGPTGP
mgnify:CR=1 FL=1